MFSEPRSAKDVDVVLKDFSLAARAGAWKPSASGGGGAVGSSGGALLLSVVGAKMSEGINFSDDLARWGDGGGGGGAVLGLLSWCWRFVGGCKLAGLFVVT